MSSNGHRLFVAELPRGGERVTLSEEGSHHARVLRLAVGDRVCLFDGAGAEVDAVVAEVRSGSVACVGEGGPRRGSDGDAPRICLVQVLPKGKKLDGIVRMTTELGVDEIYLASSERSIVRVKEGARERTKVDRLDRIAHEAARQSGRANVPKVHPPEALTKVALRAPDDAAKIVFWERAEMALPARFETREVWVVVGPEGGLSHTEVTQLRVAGYVSARLGATTLRVETAAPVAVALVMDRVR